jgi:hypothetical protein
MVIARQAPQICPIPFCSRFDSVLFTPKPHSAGDAKGKSTSGSNREAESTDAPERGGPCSSVECWKAAPAGLRRLYISHSVVLVVVVAVVVAVVPLIGALAGDAWAWAGTMIDSTMGLIHLDGRRMVTVNPPTVNISKTRRRVALNSLINCPRFAQFRPDTAATTQSCPLAQLYLLVDLLL